MSNRKRLFFEYLASAHWKELRRLAFERDDYRCSRCGSPNRLQGHHKRYRKILTLCTISDIETLCEKCHRNHHKEKARKRRKRRKEMKLHDPLTWLICNFSAK